MDSALRFGDETVLAVLAALLMFRYLPRGFRNSDLRQDVARLLARPANSLKPGQMTYQLRRLRLHGLIARIPGTHRYLVTETGQQIALFYLLSVARTIRPLAATPPPPGTTQRLLHALQTAVNTNPNQSRQAVKT